MEKLLSLGAVSLFIGMTAVTLSGSQDRGNDGIRDRFVGAWRLAWLEQEGAKLLGSIITVGLPANRCAPNSVCRVSGR